MKKMYQCQLPIDDTLIGINSLSYNHNAIKFSANGLCDDYERKKLEEKYNKILHISNNFTRQSVSYQLSKNDIVHSWIKYKEGYSATLVSQLLYEFNVAKGGTILDPFMGSGTTALVAQSMGLNSIGYDVMPLSEIAIKAKSYIYKYNIDELHDFLNLFCATKRPISYNMRIKYIRITESAYPLETEYDLSFYTELIEKSNFSIELKYLAKLCILNCLEEISYTSKDGQYLRWDVRSDKVIEANRKRNQKGLPPFKVKLNKGNLPTLVSIFSKKFVKIIDDIKYLQSNYDLISNPIPRIAFKKGSSLTELPLLESNIIDSVITSPPYCNRYDYTRIYALELVYLGITEQSIRDLRQNLISSTVESKSKTKSLFEFYSSINRRYDFEKAYSHLNNSSVINEILKALNYRNKIGHINNSGVITMVKGYFEELSFIFYELFRICKPGAKVAFVNDNVRYAGEVIPVDFISTEIAESIGFHPVSICTLKQQKGNSSQQMKKFGRVPLRKSITIWEK